ncbi:Myosin type-2 heavy chain 1, partial [Coemansia sp. RSA 2337]
ESRLEQGSDRTFTEKLYRQFVDTSNTITSAGSKRAPSATTTATASASSTADVSYFRKPRFSNTAFTIRHYAHDVTYEGDGFLEKNKDTVPDEILELLCSSSFGFLGDLASAAAAAAAAIASVSASPRIGGTRAVVGGGVLRRQAPTLAAVFRRSLSGLMATLAETEMHYIRCIKPNEAKAAWRLQAPMVLAQLRSCGVIETIRISKAGYPSRVPVRTFNERYAVLLNSGAKSRVSLGLTESQPNDDSAPTRAEHQLCTRILELCLADRGQYQVGLTKVFFRAGQWAIMEKKRSSLFDSSAVAIQRLCRGALVRRSRARVVNAVVTLQRWFRSCCDKRLVASLLRRHAVRVIERAWVARCAVRRLQYMEVVAAVRVQALARAWLARRRVGRSLLQRQQQQQQQPRSNGSVDPSIGGMRSASPAVGSSYHNKCDSLTIGEDIFAIINEFSLVAGGRYGEVDAREQLRTREQSRVSPPPLPPTRIPAPPGSSSRVWLHEARVAEDEDNSVDSDELTAISPGHLNASMDSTRQQQQAPMYPMPMTVHKRDSHSNASVKSAKTSLAELGGRHTAARARAWATKQKDRVFSAFGSNGASRRGASGSSPDPRAALLMPASPATPSSPAFLNRSFDDRYGSAELPQPPALRFHHQSHSAANLHHSSSSRSMRHASTDSLR